MSVLWTFPLISYIKLFTQSVFSKRTVYKQCAVSPLPTITSASSTSNKTSGRHLPICIITGATSGLGAATALALSKEGFCVVLAGRSSDKLSKVMSDIRRQNKEANLEAFQVDLSSFSSIMRFKESIGQWFLDSNMHPSIQLLINNAGILATTSRFTTEVHDQMMGTNYIGAFSLTQVLLPLLKNSPVPSCIINVTSFTHRNGRAFIEEIVSGAILLDHPEKEEYNVRASSTSEKNYFIGRFVTGLPSFSKKKNDSNKWFLQKEELQGRQITDTLREKFKNKPWLLEDETGQFQYQGVLEGAQTATYYLLMLQGKEFVAIPAGSWYNFNKVAQYKQLTLEEAEEKIKNRRKTVDTSIDR